MSTTESQTAPPNDRSARHQEYIDAAATIFYRRGYDSATIGDLAKLIGVTKAAIYYYVDSKEDLLYEIIRDMHELNLANLKVAKGRAGTPLEQLREYFDGHARINLEHLEKTTVVYRDLDRLSVDRREQIVALRDATQDFIRGLLKQAVDAGSVCILLNIELTSIQMFATVNALYSWYHPAGKVTADEVVRSVTEFVIAAIACTGASDTTCPRHTAIRTLTG